MLYSSPHPQYRQELPSSPIWVWYNKFFGFLSFSTQNNAHKNCLRCGATIYRQSCSAYAAPSQWFSSVSKFPEVFLIFYLYQVYLHLLLIFLPCSLSFFQGFWEVSEGFCLNFTVYKFCNTTCKLFFWSRENLVDCNMMPLCEFAKFAPV